MAEPGIPEPEASGPGAVEFVCFHAPSHSLFVYLFACLFVILHPTQEFVSHLEKSPLPVNGFKFYAWFSLSSKGTTTQWDTARTSMGGEGVKLVRWSWIRLWQSSLFLYLCIFIIFVCFPFFPFLFFLSFKFLNFFLSFFNVSLIYNGHIVHYKENTPNSQI